MCTPVYMLYIHTSARRITWQNKPHSSDLTKQTRSCLTEKISPNTTQKFWLCMSLINLLYRFVLYYFSDRSTENNAVSFALGEPVNPTKAGLLDCSFHSYPPPIHMLFSSKQKGHTCISAHVILKAVGAM